MPVNSMPPCFCDEEAMSSCDWRVGVVANYQRPGHPEAVNNQVQWELDKIPQLLAQVIFQASIAAVNEKGLEVYAAWQQGCFENDTQEEMIARVRGML